MKVKGQSEKASFSLKAQHSKILDRGVESHHFMANRWRNSDRLFSWAPESLQMVTAAMK